MKFLIYIISIVLVAYGAFQLFETDDIQYAIVLIILGLSAPLYILFIQPLFSEQDSSQETKNNSNNIESDFSDFD